MTGLENPKWRLEEGGLLAGAGGENRRKVMVAEESLLGAGETHKNLEHHHQNLERSRAAKGGRDGRTDVTTTSSMVLPKVRRMGRDGRRAGLLSSIRTTSNES